MVQVSLITSRQYQSKLNIFANLLLLLIYLMYSQASKSKLQLDLLQVLI